MNEFKQEILTKIDEIFNAYKTDHLAELRVQIKRELVEVLMGVRISSICPSKTCLSLSRGSE